MFVDLDFEQASNFLTKIKNVSTKDQWIQVANQYKVPRHSPEFWPFFDWIHAWIGQNMKEEGAIIDIRNYDLSDDVY